MRRLNPLTRPTVLVVEADHGLRMGLTDVLHEERCFVVQAETGNLALEMLRSLRPDIIIVDLKALSESTLAAFDDIARVVRKPVDLPSLLGVLETVVALRDRTATVCWSHV